MKQQVPFEVQIIPEDRVVLHRPLNGSAYTTAFHVQLTYMNSFQSWKTEYHITLRNSQTSKIFWPSCQRHLHLATNPAFWLARGEPMSDGALDAMRLCEIPKLCLQIQCQIFSRIKTNSTSFIMEHYFLPSNDIAISSEHIKCRVHLFKTTTLQ